jgi:hypothetical protein
MLPTPFEQSEFAAPPPSIPGYFATAAEAGNSLAGLHPTSASDAVIHINQQQLLPAPAQQRQRPKRAYKRANEIAAEKKEAENYQESDTLAKSIKDRK